jgi:hypothetical protein
MKLIFELGVEGRGMTLMPECDVPEYQLPEERSEALHLPHVSENELTRHYTALCKRIHGVNDGFYPLGSCTMKYNPKIDEDMAALPGFTQLHPLQPIETAQGALEVLNVVNIRRPLASTVEKIHRLQEGMQAHARLQITGMINNTNLATMTSADDLWDGYEVLRQVVDLTGIPVAYTTGKKEFLDAFLARDPDPKYVGKPVAIDVYMHRDWDSYIEYGLNTKNPHKDMY